MKKILPFLLLLISFTIYAQDTIYGPEGLNIPGSWNGWQNPPTNALFLASSTQVNGGQVIRVTDLHEWFWQTGFSTAAGGQLSAGSYEFLFTSGPSDDPWRNKWTDVNVTLNLPQTYVYHSDYGGNNNVVSLDSNKYYVINWLEQGYTDTKAIFMELSYRPARIDSLFFDATGVTDTDSVAVQIFLDTLPPGEQIFYLRYTVDGWITSSLVRFSPVNDTVYSAIIPAIPADFVEFYAFSTTVVDPSQDFDLVTLTYNNNGGEFYRYAIQITGSGDVSCNLKVQPVYPEPPLPVEDSAVTIWFDATLGNGALANYDGDIYAHTGVITNLSPDSTYWVHIVSDWGENLPQLKFTRVEPNLYKLEIPNIRQFYGITDPDEHVEKIAMVIRSADPIDPDNPQEFIVARMEDGGDFFVPVYQSGQLAATITSPNRYVFLYGLQDTVNICAFSIFADSTFLFVDDSLVIATASDSLSVKVAASDLGQGNHLAKIIAKSGTSQVQTVRSFVVLPPVDTMPLPAGIGKGVTVRNDTVYFVLWDPPALKKYAFVIGDFNNWQADADYYMKRTPDGQFFWLAVTGLDPETEYAYQYFIDGTLRLADPYARKILDPWNDKYIPEYNYPDLKPYPSGKTYGIVSVFRMNEPQYTWQNPDFVPVAINERQPDLTVYELLVRDFVETSALKDVTAKLDYLKDLGVNAIEIMPVNEFEGNISWGYNPDFYFAVDKYYGTANDFKHFVDECHARGIAVILDIVLNHSFGLSPMVRMYWDATNNRPSALNPWYNPVAAHPLSPGYDFNHESPYTREFVKEVLGYWLTEFKVDGFRFDLSKGFTQRLSSDLASWSAYDQSRIDILTDYFQFIKSVNPNAYVVLEHFADNDEETALANAGFILWQNMNTQYSQALMGWQDNSDFSWAFYQNRGFAYPNNLVFMESHDEERLMYKALTYGNQTTSYSVRDLATALDREKALVTFWSLVPGPKMMWQFGELGYDYSINYCSDGVYSEECKTSPKPVRWDYYYDPQRVELYNVYRKMLWWKQTNPFFRVANFSQNTSLMVKEQWLSSDTFNVYLIANFDVVGYDVNFNFQHTGTWYDVLGGTSITVSSLPYSAHLDAGEFYVFADKNISLVPDIVTYVTNNQSSKLTVYPNPAKDKITVVASEPGVLQIYDLQGHKLAEKKMNDATEVLSIKDLPSGSYIVKVLTPTQILYTLVVKQ